MIANQKKQLDQWLRPVFGTDSGGYTRGYGVVLDASNTTDELATVTDKARGKYVKTPTAAAYNKYFMGVVTMGRSDAGAIEIAMPGSTVDIYVGEAVTQGQIVYCDCGDTAGQFRLGGMGRGRGAAIVHKTLTSAGLAPATLLDGDMAEGLVQVIATGTSGAVVLSAEGMSRISSAAATGGLTNTLADGTVIGQRKGYYVTAVHGTPQDLVVTVTSGVQMDGSTALATITLNAANELAILEWNGQEWQLISYSGATLA